MAVAFIFPQGNTVTVKNDAQILMTNTRGPVRADEVQQNDYVQFGRGEQFLRITSPPVKIPEE